MKDLQTMLIGIDPDVTRSGVAVIDKKDKSLHLKTLTFFELFDFLSENKDFIKEIRIEASWLLKKSNWHVNNKGVGIASKIGKNTGENHETGRKIVEMCLYLDLPFIQVQPLKKCWKGTGGKITHTEICKLVKNFPKASNQEQRDALLLII